MEFLSRCLNHISAASYVPSSGPQIPDIWLPQIPHLITIERALLVLLFLFLMWPLTRAQKDAKLEKERKLIIKLSTAVGILALGIRFYRQVTGL